MPIKEDKKSRRKTKKDVECSQTLGSSEKVKNTRKKDNVSRT
jgi:hypothetical protein